MTTQFRIGAKLPSSGPLPTQLGIEPMAARLEAAGFESVWCSDHIVMVEEIESYYPYGDGGKPSWDVEAPWFDALVVMSMAVAATQHVEVGVAVLVLPVRHPVTLAKQAASIDALSGGRLVLGLGAGWMREEFEALGVPFDSRGARTDEWLALLEDCWTGRPAPFEGVHYRLPAGVICQPTPVRHPPLLIGGMSAAALRRAARAGGWLALQRTAYMEPAKIRRGVARMRAYAEEAGRDPDGLRVCLRLIESAGEDERVAAHLKELQAAGVDEVVVDVDLTRDGEGEVLERLRDAVS